LVDAHCTRYDVIAAPPSSAGGVNPTLTLVLDLVVVVTFVGRPGTVAGSVTVAEYAE
jgi:hypothetical protein